MGSWVSDNLVHYMVDSRHEIHASGASTEFPVEDRFSDISMIYCISSEHLPQHALKHQHVPWNSEGSQEVTEIMAITAGSPSGIGTMESTLIAHLSMQH